MFIRKCKFDDNDGEIKKDGMAYYVECIHCHARSFNGSTEKQAVDFWNEMMKPKDKKEVRTNA